MPAAAAKGLLAGEGLRPAAETMRYNALRRKYSSDQPALASKMGEVYSPSSPGINHRVPNLPANIRRYITQRHGIINRESRGGNEKSSLLSDAGVQPLPYAPARAETWCVQKR